MKSTMTIKKLPVWPVTLFLCLLLAIGMVTVKLWPRTVLLSECSEVYQRYSGVEGIRASFIKDFRINDTVFVDVTLLDVVDSSIWDTVCKDFGIVSINLFPEKYRGHVMRPNTFGFLYVTPDEAALTNDSVQAKDMVVYSHYDREICVFQTQNEAQRMAIVGCKIREIKN